MRLCCGDLNFRHVFKSEEKGTEVSGQGQENLWLSGRHMVYTRQQRGEKLAGGRDGDRERF